MKRIIALVLMLLLLSSCSGSGFSVSEIKDLEPYTDKVEKCYRFYSEYTDTFIPSDEYGKVYPYIGEILAYGYDFDRFVFGFCAEDGGIVCDPVYQYSSTVTTDEHTYYIMTIPDPAQTRTTVIRDDGRAACTLEEDRISSFCANGNYLQYSAWQDNTRVYRFLTLDLQPAEVDLKPDTSLTPFTSPLDYSGNCPICDQFFYSGSRYATVHGYDESYAYFHTNQMIDRVDIFSPSGDIQFSFPLESAARSLTVTPDLVFGYRQAGPSFLYDRHTEEFITLPAESTSIDVLSDNYLQMSSHTTGEKNRIYLYDVSDGTFTEYEQIFYIGGCLLTLRGGVSRVTRDGQDILRLRLLVD